MTTMLPNKLLVRLDLLAATRAELGSRNRLMPRRWDYAALSKEVEVVTELVRPLIRQRKFGTPADTVLVDKGWRGTRPINELGLVDRIAYQALVSCISESLPTHLTTRQSSSDFKQSPLEAEGINYVTKTDVAAYYEFVDHEMLEQELIAQTGEELATIEIITLLRAVMGRRVGIPQVHKSSDILGDTYIDPIRRRLTRLGYTVDTYSDDFRISTSTLGAARTALEDCAREARRLGLVLNERKTYTYGVQNYRESLESFQKAERRLFDEGNDAAVFLELDNTLYQDDNTDEQSSGETDTAYLGSAPVQGEIDQDDVVGEDGETVDTEDADSNSPQAKAAQRAWDIWVHEDESEDNQARNDASITQTMLDRSLPRLGAIGDSRPLRTLSLLLRFEPALTPQVCRYLSNYAAHGPMARRAVRDALDSVTNEGATSTWQSMWLAEASGGMIPSRATRPHHEWLEQCVESGSSALAATSAAALGRLRKGDPASMALALDRVGTEWRTLVLWALALIDASLASKCANSALERAVIECAIR